MNIFLTGATGYIGSAVARRLLREGHSVWGLARVGAKAERLRADGMNLVLGDLRKPQTYLLVAGRCDAIVHAGFEFGERAAETDRIAVQALAEAARAGGRGRLLVYTSGVWVLGPKGTAPADESFPAAPPEVVAWRPEHERLALAAAGGGVSAVVVRPGCVYGEHGGLYGAMYKSLFDERVIRVLGDGGNAWASVYLDDLADLYRLILEKRPERAVYHAVDGSADPVAAVADAFVDAAGGGEVRKVPLERARREMGALADALAMDQRVSAEKARRELGWNPLLGSPALNAPLLLAEWHDKVRRRTATIA